VGSLTVGGEHRGWAGLAAAVIAAAAELAVALFVPLYDDIMYNDNYSMQTG